MRNNVSPFFIVWILLADSFKISQKSLTLSKTELAMTRSRKIIIGTITAVLVLGIVRLIPNRDFNVDVESLKQYCQSNGYSDKYCILVDFSKPQGINRFAIYSFEDNKVVAKSLCAQGRGFR